MSGNWLSDLVMYPMSEAKQHHWNGIGFSCHLQFTFLIGLELPSTGSQLSFPVSASSMNGRSQLRQSSRKDQDSADKDQGKSRSPDAGNVKKPGYHDENKEESQTLEGK